MKDKAKGFRYRESDPEEVRKHAERKGDFDRVIKDKYKVFTPKDGKSRIRILPRTWDDDSGPRHWAYPLYLHYDVGPDNGQYPCPAKMAWGPCPVCEERAKLDEEDKDLAAKMRPSLSQLCWVIDRNNEELGPQVFKMPASKLEKPLCDLSRDEQGGGILKIDHPDEGYDISFSKGGKGRNTDYSAAAIARKPSYLSQDEKEQLMWLRYIEDNPLPDVVQPYDYDYIEKVFGGKASKATADEDEGFETRRARTAKARGDDEEEPAPRSRSRAPVDDEKADLDEPAPRSRRMREEPEEEAPRTRRRAAEPDDEPEPRPRRAREPEPDDEPAPRSRRPANDTDDLEAERERPRRRATLDDDQGEVNGRDRGRESGRMSSRTTSRGDDDEPEPRRRSTLSDDVSEGLQRRRSRA